MADFFEVIVIKADGTEARTQLSTEQMGEIFATGGRIFIRKYLVTFTNPDGSTFLSLTFLSNEEIAFINLPFKKTEFRDDEIFEGFGFTPTTPPIQPPTTPPIQPPTTPPIQPPTTPPIQPPTTPPTTPTPNTPNIDWMNQSLGVWDISGDRITGEILFIITPKFDPAWYRRNLHSIVHITDIDGVPIQAPKFNNLTFTATERDERITFDEAAFGNTELMISSFVWSDDAAFSFSEVKRFTIKAEDPPQIPPPVQGTKLNFLQALPFIGIGALFLNEGLRNKTVGKKKK